MKKLKIWYSPLSQKIYAGQELSDGSISTKQDVTEAAVDAVAQFFLRTGKGVSFTHEVQKYCMEVLKPKKD